MNVFVCVLCLQFKLFGVVFVGLVVVLLCVLVGLVFVWFKLFIEVLFEVVYSCDVECLQCEFRGQVQEWKNVLLCGYDDVLCQCYLDVFDNEGCLVEWLVKGLVISLDVCMCELVQVFVGLYVQLQQDYYVVLQVFVVVGYDLVVGDNLVCGKDCVVVIVLDVLSVYVMQVVEVVLVVCLQQVWQILLLCVLLMVLVVVLLLIGLVWWLWCVVVQLVLVVEVVVCVVVVGDLQYVVQVCSCDEIGCFVQVM